MGSRIHRGIDCCLPSFIEFWNPGMFLDEAFSWLHSQFPVADLLGILTNLNHTPLYFFLLKYYLLFVPQTEFGLRSLSVIFSILSLISVIVIMYRLGNSCRNFFRLVDSDLILRDLLCPGCTHVHDAKFIVGYIYWIITGNSNWISKIITPRGDL